MPVPFPHLGRAAVLLLLAANALPAQTGRPLAVGDQAWKLTTSALVRTNAGLDTGGDVSSTDYRFKLDSQWGLAGGRSLGASLEYKTFNYDFSRPGGWSDIQSLDLGLNYNHPLSRTASIFVAPSLGSAKETGAGTGNSLTYGGVFGYSRQIDETLSLGLGAGLFGGLADTRGFPFIFVRWQINDAWRLGNPFRPGPAGPAGLELVYTGLDRWEIGFGSSYRSERFKLNAATSGAATYGEDQGVALFVRATRTLAPGSQLDLYVGSVVAGKLSWDDANGHTLRRTDYDPALLAALAFTATF